MSSGIKVRILFKESGRTRTGGYQTLSQLVSAAIVGDLVVAMSKAGFLLLQLRAECTDSALQSML